MATEAVIIGVLSLFIIILGWVVNKIWTDSKAKDERIYGQIDKLDGSVTKLYETISGLNGILLSQEEKIRASSGICDLKHGALVARVDANDKTINARINTNEKRLNEHSREIKLIHEKIKS